MAGLAVVNFSITDFSEGKWSLRKILELNCTEFHLMAIEPVTC